MRNKLIILLLVVVIFSLFIVNNDNIFRGESLKKEEYSSNNFYLEIPKAEINKLIENISLIKIGASYDEIIKTIGPPTYDKHLMPKNPNDENLFRVLDYYIKKYEKDFTNEKHDMFIRFELDRNGILVNIKYIPDNLKRFRQ